jgi:type VI secretion system protein ImpM
MLILPFNRTETQSAACYSLFGKLPNRPDFVRVNANHPVALEFDGLIQNAYERMAQHSSLPDTNEASLPLDFLYASKDRQHIMIGALMPSQDQAGRRYPFVAAAILPRESIAGYLPVSPIAYEVFFDGLREQVVNAVENSVEALSCRQFLETHLSNYETAVDDLELARSVVDRFMSIQPAGRLADLLTAAPEAANLQQALLNVAFYQAYLHRFDNQATNQLVVFPLSARKGEQSLIASCWLALLSSLWSPMATTPAWHGSYFFLRRPDGATRLVTSVGRMPNSFAQVLLGGAIDPSMLLDLGSANEAWMSHRMYAESSYALGRVLADPECNLSTLCGFLGGMNRQLGKNV